MKSKQSKKKIFIILIIAIFVVGAGVTGFLLFKDRLFQPNSDMQVSEEQLVELSNENYKVFEKGFTDVKVTDEKSAIESVNSVADVLGINDVEKELKIVSTNTFDGETFYRMQQYYNDIPVHGRDVVLVANRDGEAVSLTANSINSEKLLNQKEFDDDFDDKKAVKAIKESFDEVYSAEDEGAYYFSLDNSDLVLAHLYNVFASVDEQIASYEVMVSANNYNVVFTNNLVRTSSETDYSYKVSDSEYCMYDEKRNIVMLNSNGKTVNNYSDHDIEKNYVLSINGLNLDELNAQENLDVINHYIENNSAIENSISDKFKTNVYLPVEFVTSNNNTWDENSVNYMKNAETTYDFYKSVLSRTGYDDKKGEMFISYNDEQGVDKGKNAFSCGNFLCFGYAEDSESIDLVAHEFTHSVENSISNMNYKGESGAIMEAYSDIFGEIVEDYSDQKLDNNCDWIHNNTRNIKNPHDSKNGKYPIKYKEILTWGDTGDNSEDRGNVHRNSTVISHAAYLMNNGINGDDSMKIDTELLAKIWYKSLYLLHSNATFNQCADAVYNAALMTKGITFEQLVCIRTAFGEAGLDVEAITSYNVLSGTTVYAISYDNKKYQNYHIKIIDCETGNTVAEKNITDTNGYKLDLEKGKYIISLTDNETNGSKNTFNKTINVRVIPNKKVNSYINILTDFYIDYDAPLKEKLNELISDYGIASDETYTANMAVISNSSWTNREGVVSAKLSDLDGDDINELVVVHLIGGELNSDSENLEVQVYYYTNNGIKSAGAFKFFTGDDFTQKQIDSYIHQIGEKNYIFIESDFAMYGTDVSVENSYDVLEYKNQKLTRKLRVYLETDFDYYATSKWTEVTWDGDIENKREIYYNGYKNNNLDSNFTRGAYKDSDNPIKDYFIDFGLSATDDVFPTSQITRFFNSKGTDKLFEIVLSRGTELTKYTSSLTDYTGLDHSKSTTSAEKAEEWKELYISYFNEQENKSILDYASFNIIDVDDDGTPELVYTGFAAMGTHMIWIKNGEVQDQAVGYGEFKYIPSDKLVYCQYMNHGCTSDTVFLFENQDLTQVFSGQILPEENGFENPGWSIDGENVSETEYNKRLNDSFDFNLSKSLDYDDSIQGSDILDKIKNY